MLAALGGCLPLALLAMHLAPATRLARRPAAAPHGGA
jgi:hypothetical protein